MRFWDVAWKLIALVCLPLVTFSIYQMRAADKREVLEHVRQEYLTKAEFREWVMQHEKWSSERTAVIIGKIDAITIQLDGVTRRLDRIEQRLDNRP